MFAPARLIPETSPVGPAVDAIIIITQEARP